MFPNHLDRFRRYNIHHFLCFLARRHQDAGRVIKTPAGPRLACLPTIDDHEGHAVMLGMFRKALAL